MGFALSYPHPPYPLGRDFLPFHTHGLDFSTIYTITLMDWDQVTCSQHVTLHHSAHTTRKTPIDGKHIAHTSAHVSRSASEDFLLPAHQP
jgi:hypothetical protein